MSGLLKNILPEFARELRDLLAKAERADLADRVEGLAIIGRCHCDDDFCSSFYTAPKPDGAYGLGHSNLTLSPKEGMIILDLVDDEIQYVEVIDRSDVQKLLFDRVP